MAPFAADLLWRDQSIIFRVLLFGTVSWGLLTHHSSHKILCLDGSF